MFKVFKLQFCLSYWEMWSRQIQNWTKKISETLTKNLAYMGYFVRNQESEVEINTFIDYKPFHKILRLGTLKEYS